MNGQAEVEVDYKRKYTNLKRKLKFLVYVSMCFSMYLVELMISMNLSFQTVVNPLASFSVQEQECFQEELRRAQRKLLKVSRDKR